MNGPEKVPQWQAERLATLLYAIGAIPISDAERASLTWLCGFEADTVANLAAVIWRARGRSAAVAARGRGREMRRLREALETARGEVISRHREADLYRGQLIDLCEWAAIEAGEDPHAALLTHLRGPEEPGAGVSS